MNNFKGFVKTDNTPSVQLESMTFQQFLLGLEGEGFFPNAVKTIHSTQFKNRDGSEKDYLQLLQLDEEGNQLGRVSINISRKLTLSGVTDEEKFLECYENYPIYIGQGDNGKYATVAPVGTFDAKPATRINLSSIIKSGSAKAGVPSMG
jgi:hypothetical protein